MISDKTVLPIQILAAVLMTFDDQERYFLFPPGCDYPADIPGADHAL
jgi:hypothetical protein